ncbi:MAG: DUF2156 domain-containing protein [Deltaproteobacteria bacterium]|nr:DUF2156 domain-containing protein [Deltaproteobacteria bacterium]
MVLNFKPISLEQQSEYSEYFAKCPQKASDYSFVNLWGWAEEYGLDWAWTDNLVWIRQTIPEILYWAPIGSWDGIDWKSCFDEYSGRQTPFIRIPEKLLRVWKESYGVRIAIEEERGNWDYIYSISELIELKGKRFHKKKNLLNQFRKNYNFQFIPFDTETIHKAMTMQEDWCTWRDCESSDILAAENNAVFRVLNSWEKLNGLIGGAIIVNETMAAYTVAESLSADMLLIHFEKGNTDFKGIYQAINQLFLENSGKNYEIVNREQDLGDEGLRKAKLSYHPTDFLKKYRVQTS